MVYIKKHINSCKYMAFEFDEQNPYKVTYSAINPKGDNYYATLDNLSRLSNPPYKNTFTSSIDYSSRILVMIGPFPSWESLATALEDCPEYFI